MTPPGSTLRSALAIVAGYLVFGLSAGLLFGMSGQDPHRTPSAGFAVFSIVYGMTFSFLGGCLAATIAGRRARLHAAILAAILGVIAVISMVVQWRQGSVWSELSVLLTMVPAVLAGGYVRERQGTRPSIA